MPRVSLLVTCLQTPSLSVASAQRPLQRTCGPHSKSTWPPSNSRYGELIRLDMPPPRRSGASRYAFVEYKEEADCEKALELNDTASDFAENLTVQIARLEQAPKRTRPRNRNRNDSRRSRYDSHDSRYDRPRGDSRGGAPAPASYGLASDPYATSRPQYTYTQELPPEPAWISRRGRGSGDREGDNNDHDRERGRGRYPRDKLRSRSPSRSPSRSRQ